MEKITDVCVQDTLSNNNSQNSLTNNNSQNSVGPVSLPKGIDIGNCVLSLAIDDSQVPKLIERIERAVAAFKAEWGKEIITR